MYGSGLQGRSDEQGITPALKKLSDQAKVELFLFAKFCESKQNLKAVKKGAKG